MKNPETHKPVDLVPLSQPPANSNRPVRYKPKLLDQLKIRRNPLTQQL